MSKQSAIKTKLLYAAAKMLVPFMTPTGRMLREEVIKFGFGESPYRLRYALDNWREQAGSLADDIVLSVMLHKDALARVEHDIVRSVAGGWKDTELTEMTVGGFAGGYADALVKSVIETKEQAVMRATKRQSIL